MKPLIIAGNWKSNKTIPEAKIWLQEWNVKCQMSNVKWENKTIVLCVPFTLLDIMKEDIQKLELSIQLGAQDVSPFPEGAYTGEVSARQIKEFADWVIIGHSERRREFGETDKILFQKSAEAKQVGLKIIYCVQNEQIQIPTNVDIVAFEPPWAISVVSNWKSESPENAEKMCKSIKTKIKIPIIYGGSASPENVTSFVAQDDIDGVFSGGASLDPDKFWNLIEQA